MIHRVLLLLAVSGVVSGLVCGAACAEPTGRVRVIDGDTVWVGTEKVRLFGIDAPEQDQICLTPEGESWACGRWVTQQVTKKYQGLMVICETIDRDRYGRRVGRCQVAGHDIGETLVSEGLAFAFERYSTDYVAAEKKAMMAHLGLHRGQVQAPASYRREKTHNRRAVAASPPDPNCVIKGNIGRGDRRIYHVPGQRDYDHTGINEKKGERWFCSEREARAAGWRRARR